MGAGGSGGGLDPPESEMPYPDPNQTRCLGKILTKNVFLRPFWAIFIPASDIFRKVALPRFLGLPTFDHHRTIVALIPKIFFDIDIDILIFKNFDIDIDNIKLIKLTLILIFDIWITYKNIVIKIILCFLH